MGIEAYSYIIQRQELYWTPRVSVLNRYVGMTMNECLEINHTFRLNVHRIIRRNRGQFNACLRFGHLQKNEEPESGAIE